MKNESFKTYSIRELNVITNNILLTLFITHTCSRVLAASKSPIVIAVDPPINGPPCKKCLSKTFNEA